MFAPAQEPLLFTGLQSHPDSPASVTATETKRPRKTKQTFTDEEKAEYWAGKDAQVKQALAQVSERQQQLAADPEAQRAWLRALPHFHEYSFNNYLNFLVQRPDATRVDSFDRWKEKGRYIRKGETAMEVLCPVTKRVPMVDAETGLPVLDAKGKQRTRSAVVRGRFRAVKGAFDISQTEPVEGYEAPPAPQGAQQLHDDLCAVMAQRGVRVLDGGGDDPLARAMLLTNPNAGGYYSADKKAIVLAPGLDIARKARVMAHECAHQELHSNQPGYQDLEDRRIKEVEAEASAYALCAAYGIDSNEDYSLRYINNWADGDPKRLATVFSTVHNGVRALLRDIDATKAPTEEVA